MNVGLYQSAASMTALERWQDAVSQNIASSGVSGFKKRTVEVSGASMGTLNSGANNQNVSAGVLPQVSVGVSYMPGQAEPTGKATDMAIDGPGFFQVQGPNNQTLYTRDGQLHVSPDRTLVTKEGYPILSESGTPITIQPDAGDLDVSADGTVSQTTPTGSTQIGKFAVVAFSHNDRLESAGNGLFVAPQDAVAAPVEKPVVMSGYLEQSNVSPVNEMISLVQISRAYEANQKTIQSQDDAMQHALDALG
ncbi:MAG TPA: flagellar hook basal-body protein [Opitutaceae bacterium]